MAKVRILNQTYDLPALAGDRFRGLHSSIEARQQIIRDGERSKGLLQRLLRAKTPLSIDERLEELNLLIQDYDTVILRLGEEKIRYLDFFSQLTEDVRKGISQRIQDVRDMENERLTLQRAAIADDDDLLLDHLQNTQERLGAAVKMMGQAALLILKKISLCQDSLQLLTHDQNLQKQLLEKLIKRLQNHQRMYHLQKEVERFEQDVQRMSQAAIQFEDQLRECFTPLQGLLEQVSSVDGKLHHAIEEIEHITRALTEENSDLTLTDELSASDERILDFLIHSHVKRDRLEILLTDISQQDALDQFLLDDLPDENQPKPTISSALNNIECIIDLKMLPLLPTTPPNHTSHAPQKHHPPSPTPNNPKGTWGLRKGALHSLAISPNSKLLAVAGRNKLIEVWDLPNKRKIHTLTAHTDQVLSLAFSPNSGLLASSSRDRKIILWNPLTGTKLKTLTGHTDQILNLSFGPQPHLLASCSRDTTLRLWELTTGRTLYTLKKHANWVNDVAIAPNGKWMASAAGDATIRIWEPLTGKPLEVLQAHSKGIESLAISPNSNLLASGSWDSTIRVWNIHTGECLHTLNDHTSDIRALAFSPSGKTLASGSADTTIKLWNTSTSKCLLTLTDHHKAISSIQFSPDGSVLASTSSDSTLKVRELKNYPTIL